MATALLTGAVLGLSVELTYFHVELDSHDVLLTEGAPSKSFVNFDSGGCRRDSAAPGALACGEHHIIKRAGRVL